MARQATVRRGCSQRQACRLFSLHRATFRYRTKLPRPPRAAADEAVVALSLEHPELGADKIASMARREGHRLGNQRARRLRREECLAVPPRKPKESRRGESTGRHPQKATHRGHVWTWDFIHDWTLKGGAFRVLSVVDEHTREVLALHVDRHIGSRKVREVMEGLIAEHGPPGYIRSDNGPEFVARHLQEWLGWNRIRTLYIEPGSPWQNGFVESFHDKFRAECLARELFYTLGEARVVIGDWRRKYNHVRPHRSLGMLTPAEFAAKCAAGIVGRPGCGTSGSDESMEPILAASPSARPHRGPRGSLNRKVIQRR
jgi:putative transposase